MSIKDEQNSIQKEQLRPSNAQDSLSVIMPAYNEGAVIQNNLLAASNIISDFCQNYEIIAVNDGSSDDTEIQIKKAAAKDPHISYVTYQKNRGKGGAISAGVEKSTSHYTAFLDSDLELSPAMLKDFLQSLKKENADIVIGSKMHKASKLEYPFTRKILSFGYYMLLKILFRLKIKDTQTGIKVFKTDIIKPICKTLSTYGFAYDIEILAKANKKGYRILEMPIILQFNRDRREKSRFSPKVVINIFKETLSVRKAVKNY